MAQHLTEAQMKEYFGWVQESKMAARYVHLSGKQVDDAILRLHGLVAEDRSEDILKREPCPRCKEVNDVNNKYCQKCWLPLTEDAARETHEIDRKDQDGIITVGKLLELVKKHRLTPDRTRRLRIFMGKPAFDANGGFATYTGKFQAMASGRYAASTILHDRELALAQYRPERYNDPALARFAADQVEVTPDPALVGFLGGGAFLWLVDKLLPHLHAGVPSSHAEGVQTSWQRSILLVTAITPTP